MSELPAPTGEMLLYTTEDGQVRVECRFVDDTLWLTQALMATLFDKDVRTINEHLSNVFEEGEVDPQRTIRKFRMVRPEGASQREVARVIEPLGAGGAGARVSGRSPPGSASDRSTCPAAISPCPSSAGAAWTSPVPRSLRPLRKRGGESLLLRCPCSSNGG